MLRGTAAGVGGAASTCLDVRGAAYIRSHVGKRGVDLGQKPFRQHNGHQYHNLDDEYLTP